MKDLFTLNDEGETGTTETSNIFSQLAEDVNVVGLQKVEQDKQGALANKGNNAGTVPSKRKGKEKADSSDGEVDEETNILKSLFDAHGIHVSFSTAYFHSQVPTITTLHIIHACSINYEF